VVGVGIAFFAIITCLALLGLALYRSQVAVRRFVQVIVPVEEPASAAAYEMEINVIGAGLGVQRYLATGDAEHRERVRNDEADFRRLRAKYELVTRTKEEMCGEAHSGGRMRRSSPC